MGEINREEQRRYRRRDMSLAKDKIEAKCKRRNLLDLKESKFSFVYVLHQKCSNQPEATCTRVYVPPSDLDNEDLSTMNQDFAYC
ncbi:PREDICTED: uncharacterized protein LOC104804770 isoform X2 [Tarenaya hassleriana]|uniref:uncharacterized protein LOC104804770 isoform X2 n=1 Tax=Tarenaya hassleriana TaxID=28532 RepID=UPI0008FD2BB8|nr:PREDICTED: uncharacterized protein LOC104804770 isoform X2 [Tarenaya hassleriana]